MTALLRWQPSRPPKIDPRNTGVTFVDVLFALVVGKILEVSVKGTLPSAAILHLLVGAVLTIASWIGYHNSVNRVQYFLRFWNLPIFMFLIDIALVFIYWLVPVATVNYKVDGRSPQPEALRITLLVAAAALLYVLWDFIAWRMRKSGLYSARPEDKDIPGRRYASILLFGLTALVLGVVWCKQPHTDTPVIVVDVILILLLLGYRTLKEGITPPDAVSRDDAQPPA
jgi:hypothetical protein